MERLVTVARCGDVNEAEVARVVLADAGIRAVVAGGDLASTLSHLGPAVGDVLVQTSAADAERAQEIVGRLRAGESSDREPWFCSTCQHNVDANFDLCWKCGDERTEIPAVPETQERRTRYIPGQTETAEHGAQLSNDPYAPPDVAPADAREFLPEGIESVEKAEEVALRALRAAVIGLLLLPPLLSFYAIYLLFGLWGVPFSASGRRRVRWAWGFAALGVLFGAITWAEMLS